MSDRAAAPRAPSRRCLRHAAAGVALALAGAAAPALAVPADDTGAARIETALQRYLGRIEGVVDATPQGDSYRLTLDPQPLVSAAVGWLLDAARSDDTLREELDLPDSVGPLTVEITPLAFALTDNGDGTWLVVQDQRFALTGALPGVIEMEQSGRLQLDGLWSEALQGFSRVTMTETDGRQRDRRFLAPDRPVSESETRRPRTDSSSTSAANPAGGLDVTARSAGQGITLDQKILYGEPTAEGRQDTFAISAGVAGVESESAMTGLRWREMLALWEWLVARRDLAELRAGQEDLRGLIRAALPLFDRARVSVPITGLHVESAVLRGGFERIETELETSGLIREGRVRLAQRLSGPDLPLMMLDPWMRPLVPRAVGYDVTVSGFDLAAAADLLVAAMDLANPDDPFAALDPQAMQRAVLPDGALRVDLGPGSIEAADYAIRWSGFVEGGETVPPTGRIRIEATGLDTVEGQLATAYGSRAAEALGMLRAARAEARREGDTDIWEIDAADLAALAEAGADEEGAGEEGAGEEGAGEEGTPMPPGDPGNGGGEGTTGDPDAAPEPSAPRATEPAPGTGGASPDKSAPLPPGVEVSL